MQYRSLSTIASDIKKDWKNVNYAAKPYLTAMSQLENLSDNFMADDARSIVSYFLSNAQTWRGIKAKQIKQELNAMLAGKPYNYLPPTTINPTNILSTLRNEAVKKILRKLEEEVAGYDYDTVSHSLYDAKPLKKPKSVLIKDTMAQMIVDFDEENLTDIERLLGSVSEDALEEYTAKDISNEFGAVL